MRIILGAAQLGMAYGITNYAGVKPNDLEVFSLLENAYLQGIRTIDSAQAYGDANQRIADFHKQSSNKFQVINKFLRDPIQSSAGLKQLREQIQLELDNLGIAAFDTIMLHYAYSVNEYIDNDFLQSLVADGFAKRLGISINHKQEYELLSDRFTFDVLQLPYNILNQQNFDENFLTQLKYKGCEIHVRSIFLQGLLLGGASKIPEYLSPLTSYVKALEDCAASMNVSVKTLCLMFALANKAISYLVIGIQSRAELDDLISCYNQAEQLLISYPNIDWLAFACPLAEMLDPAKWSKLKDEHANSIPL